MGEIDPSCLKNVENKEEVQKLFRLGFHPDLKSNRKMSVTELNDKLEEYATIDVGPKKKVNMIDWIKNVYDKYRDICETDKYFEYRCGSANMEKSKSQEKRRNEEGRDANSNHGFDYHPVLFSFSLPEDGTMLHVLAIHGSTGEKSYGRGSKKEVPEQNVLEMSFLQEFCAQAVTGENRSDTLIILTHTGTLTLTPK